MGDVSLKFLQKRLETLQACLDERSGADIVAEGKVASKTLEVLFNRYYNDDTIKLLTPDDAAAGKESIQEALKLDPMGLEPGESGKMLLDTTIKALFHCTAFGNVVFFKLMYSTRDVVIVDSPIVISELLPIKEGPTAELIMFLFGRPPALSWGRRTKENNLYENKEIEL